MGERLLEEYLQDCFQRVIDPDLYPSWRAYGWPERDVKYPLRNQSLIEELKGKVYIGTLSDFKQGPYPLDRDVSLLIETNNQSCIYGAVLHKVNTFEFDERGLPQNFPTAQSLRRGIRKKHFYLNNNSLGIRPHPEGFSSDTLFDEFVSLTNVLGALAVYEHMTSRGIDPEKILTWKHNGQPVD